MPHCRSGKRRTPRNKREEIKKDLDVQLRNLRVLGRKHSANALRIKLHHVSLGELRASYKPRQVDVDPVLLQEAPNFTTYQSSQDTPLLLYGSDNGFIAARFCIKDSTLPSQVSAFINALPPTKRRQHKGIERSPGAKVLHCGFWSAYMPEPRLTAEHREHQKEIDELLDLCQPVFREMTAILGGLAPRVFKEFTQYPLPNDARRPCGAWSACAVNNGGNDPDETKVHRDVKESRYGYSAVFACGDYTGGDIILYQLRCKIEMQPGDILLFPDSLIHHNNERAEGSRESIVAFTQDNMNDYWVRKYRIHKRGVSRHAGKTMR